MAFLAAAGPAIQAISGALGIFSGIKSLIGGGKKDKPPEPKAAPAAPKQEDAAKKAEDQVARRRRISLLSGGNTNITRGQAVTEASDVGTKKLLGT